ncbi:hypothetical protein HPO96_08290 [Kribbella sandramycini]|uniref:Uncharacterized protein n=1 Tax=Kribbella sandramycini TaxID=60450 RepID=A0A7Y4KX53_9ACTN|nr:hypothetical protein [Kribbella sandramycini]MBB6569936.1 hypothetical protein [Kribbella sandramycini]NOL40240.1 hypothetical protein [Kribbella sandramycini]
MILAGCATGPPAAGPLTEIETSRLYDAEQLLVRECVERAGFKYWPVARSSAAEHRKFPYGVEDVDWARRHGYGIALEAKSRARDAQHPNRKYFSSLAPDQQEKYLSTVNGPTPVGLTAQDVDGRLVTHSDQGCDAEAQRALYGDLPGWYRAIKLTNGLPRARALQVLKAESFQPLVAAWSRCMKSRGFDFIAPVESARLMRHRTGLAPAEEIRTAIAEAECLHTSGLAAAAQTADRRVADEQRRQYKSELDTKLRLQRAALPTALKVLERG